MQHLSWKIFCAARPINLIAEHWVTKMMKMHANLMGPSAVQTAFEETGPITRSNDAILGFGRAPSERSRAHSLSMDWMSSDCFLDYTGCLMQFSGHERKINLFHGPVRELSG